MTRTTSPNEGWIRKALDVVKAPFSGKETTRPVSSSFGIKGRRLALLGAAGLALTASPEAKAFDYALADTSSYPESSDSGGTVTVESGLVSSSSDDFLDCIGMNDDLVCTFEDSGGTGYIAYLNDPSGTKTLTQNAAGDGLGRLNEDGTTDSIVYTSEDNDEAYICTDYTDLTSCSTYSSFTSIDDNPVAADAETTTLGLAVVVTADYWIVVDTTSDTVVSSGALGGTGYDVVISDTEMIAVVGCAGGYDVIDLSLVTPTATSVATSFDVASVEAWENAYTGNNEIGVAGNASTGYLEIHEASGTTLTSVGSFSISPDRIASREPFKVDDTEAATTLWFLRSGYKDLREVELSGYTEDSTSVATFASGPVSLGIWVEPPAAVAADDDGDGYDTDEDCDDGDAAINPGATEIDCDGVDQDCSEGVSALGIDLDELVDNDGDGTADCSDDDGDGLSEDDGDCNDIRSDVYTGAPEPGCVDDLADAEDLDCDGVEPGECLYDNDGDGFEDAAYGGEDCDDGNAAIHPDADENCSAVDMNCDDDPTAGATDTDTYYEDIDEDGFGGETTADECEAPDGYVSQGGDTDDSNPYSYPGTEYCVTNFDLPTGYLCEITAGAYTGEIWMEEGGVPVVSESSSGATISIPEEVAYYIELRGEALENHESVTIEHGPGAHAGLSSTWYIAARRVSITGAEWGSLTWNDTLGDNVWMMVADEDDGREHCVSLAINFEGEDYALPCGVYVDAAGNSTEVVMDPETGEVDEEQTTSEDAQDHAATVQDEGIDTAGDDSGLPEKEETVHEIDYTEPDGCGGCGVEGGMAISGSRMKMALLLLPLVLLRRRKGLEEVAS
jgi:hypothetical protein